MGMEPATNMGLGSVCAFVTQRVDQKEKKWGRYFGSLILGIDRKENLQSKYILVYKIPN
jgi:hypothetical protein